MSLFYRLMYGIGVTPWEEMATLPIAHQIREMFDREERERSGPRGRVLDLGCGSGLWSVELARRGWQVTGVELVPKALGAARRRAAEAGVDVRFVQGDATRLATLGLGESFDLLLDFGMVHGMPARQRAAVGQGATALAADGASLLMLAWAPGWRGPLPRGMDRGDVEDAYPGWKVVDDVPQDVTGAPGAVRAAKGRWFRLTRITE